MNQLSKHNTDYRVSVVIPTIGEGILEKAIVALNNGSLPPNEIIICIPREYLNRISNIKWGNIKILALDIKGQVKQRIEGFKIAQNNYVLQLDSDILVQSDTLQNLVKAINEKGLKSAICPNYSLANDTSKLNIFSFFKYIQNLLMDGRLIIPKGIITKAGIQMPPPFNLKDTYSISEWVPGGCVMHYKNNLELIDYYPFAGKAYGEDVIHSIMLRKKGISLYVYREAVVLNEGMFEEIFKSYSELHYYIKRIFNYKLLILKLTRGNKIRFFFWMLIFYIKTHIKHLITSKRSR